jgi:hypothetical protein
MAEKMQSVFGVYAQQLQSIIDLNLDKFAPVWYPKYFDMAPTQSTLSYMSVIGASRIEAAASVVERSSPSPLRSRAAIKTLTGNIPAIKEKFLMKESDYRDFLTFQALPFADGTAKREQILQLLFDDAKKAGTSVHKRLDIFTLEMISTGACTLTTTNNPDGLVEPVTVDLLMPAGNKSFCSVVWTSPTTSKPITDITAVVQAANAAGRKFSKILMSYANFIYFSKSAEVIASLISFNSLQKGAQVATLDKINEYLSANLLPNIEVVNEMIGIEKDGVITSIKPFADTNISFIPDGKLGTIKNALAMEQMEPVQGINYGVYNKALVSKWRQSDPWGEYTGVELNAFPSLDSIDNIFLMNVSATS